jgi:ribosomal-protein-alanine N-acetyltransferase
MSVLQTERLILRPFQEDDEDDLFALWRDLEAMQFNGDGKVRTRPNIEEERRRIVDHWREHGFGVWALFRKTDGRFAGGCGVGYFYDLPDVELAYTVARAYRGLGLATV